MNTSQDLLPRPPQEDKDSITQQPRQARADKKIPREKLRCTKNGDFYVCEPKMASELSPNTKAFN